MPPKNRQLPTKEALMDAMEVASTSADAAEYLATRFEEIFKEAKVGSEGNPLREQIQVFAKHVAYQLNRHAEIWKGQAVEPSTFKNLHEYLADEAIAVLVDSQDTTQIIQFNYRVGDDASFVRGYAAVEKSAEHVESPDNVNVSSQTGRG